MLLDKVSGRPKDLLDPWRQDRIGTGIWRCDFHHHCLASLVHF